MTKGTHEDIGPTSKDFLDHNKIEQRNDSFQA